MMVSGDNILNFNSNLCILYILNFSFSVTQNNIVERAYHDRARPEDLYRTSRWTF